MANRHYERRNKFLCVLYDRDQTRFFLGGGGGWPSSVAAPPTKSTDPPRTSSVQTKVHHTSLTTSALDSRSSAGRREPHAPRSPRRRRRSTQHPGYLRRPLRRCPTHRRVRPAACSWPLPLCSLHVNTSFHPLRRHPNPLRSPANREGKSWLFG
jgi:hypothetical protein